MHSRVSGQYCCAIQSEESQTSTIPLTLLFPSSQITEMQNNNYMSVIPANATKTHHSVSMLSVTSKLSPLVPLGLNKALFSVLSNGSCVRSRTNTPAAKPPILIPRVLDLCQYLDTFIRVWKKRHIVEPV